MEMEIYDCSLLDISDNRIKALPKSITKLFHLQTFRFSECGSLRKLPKKMGDLVSLRHLDFSYSHQTPTEVGCMTGLQTLPFFVVGRGKGCKMEDLGCLKDLKGKLEIVKLEHVRDKEEAERANLFAKSGIFKLGLRWSYGRLRCSLNEENVLEGLQPQPNIRSLEIENYKGDKFPSWLSTPTLDNLEKLTLKGCNRCKQVPTLGHLPRLKVLEIDGMDSVNCMGDEFYSSSSNECGGGDASTMVLFPSLKKFSLTNMESLVEWRVPPQRGDAAAAVMFPCLEDLDIYWCPHLESVPSMSHLSSNNKLVRLKIRECNALSQLCGEFNASTPLKSFIIDECQQLASIPRGLQHCKALEELQLFSCEELRPIYYKLGGGGSGTELWPSLRRVSIVRCGRLTSFPIRRLLSWPSLVFLVVRGCDGLISIADDDEEEDTQSVIIKEEGDKLISGGVPTPDSSSSSLIQLTISNCKSFVNFPTEEEFDIFCGLTLLKRLAIGGFSEELEAFPAGIANSMAHHLSGSLEELTISGWKTLKSGLPRQLQRLTSLKKLGIWYFYGDKCEEEALSDWLGNLSTVMRGLSNLQMLEICQCPLLGKNCDKGGSERPKISHIPNIKIYKS